MSAADTTGPVPIESDAPSATAANAKELAPQKTNGDAAGTPFEPIITGFEDLAERLLGKKVAARKRQSEQPEASSAPAKQSTQQSGPNVGNFAAQLPPNTATPTSLPINSARAVPIGELPLIPRKREWLHGTDLMRGAVSMMVAPGARAKTTWLLTCALACASGRSLLGANVYGGPLSVLYLSAEDSRNEIALRLRAAMQHHDLSNADVSRLFVIGADQWGLPLLGTANGAPRIDPVGWNALIAELDRINPDVLIIDPLINVMGGVDANNSSVASLLTGQLAALAATGRIAVMIAHHAAKGRDPKSAESAMGAATFVNLCRIVLAIEPLDKDDAAKIGLPTWEATSVSRVVGTKQNYRPPDQDDRWFRLKDVHIENQQPPIYVTGDRVVVIEKYEPGSSGPAFPPQLIRDALLALMPPTRR